MIGIFDSGVGGLTVAREMMRRLPVYDFIYFGDTARTPYGTKGGETITRYALEDARILIDRGAKIIVIACNTVSATAVEALRGAFPDIPIFEVIAPAVAKAIETTRNKKIGVIGTNATVGSGVYERLLLERAKQVKVFSKSCPLFVVLAEEGWFEERETKMIARRYLHDLKTKNIDTLILGCTHYPLLKDVIARRMGRGVRLVDSAEEVVGVLQNFLKSEQARNLQLGKNGKRSFLVSDKSERFESIAEAFLGECVSLEKISMP